MLSDICSLRTGFLAIYELTITTNTVVEWVITGFSFQHRNVVFILCFFVCEQVVKCFDLAEKIYHCTCHKHQLLAFNLKQNWGIRVQYKLINIVI